MVADAQPIVEGLEREVDVFGDFEFEDVETACMINAEQVESATFAVEAAEGLPVEAVGGDVGFDFADIAADLRFEPALGFAEVDRVNAVFGFGVAEAEYLFDELFDGRQFGEGGFSFAAEAVFEAGYFVAACGTETGDLETPDAVSEAAISFFDHVDFRVAAEQIDPPCGTAEAGITRRESAFEVAVIGGVEKGFAACVVVKPNIDFELGGIEMTGQENDAAGVLLRQVEEEAAGGDFAMPPLHPVEPDEGEGEGVKAGIAVWRGEGGDGLLAPGEEGGGVSGRKRIFEFGFATEGLPTPIAVIAIEEEAKLFGEGGAIGFFDGGSAAGVRDIDERDREIRFSKSERFEFQFLAGSNADVEDAAGPEAVVIPRFEPGATGVDINAEAVLREYERLFARLEEGGGVAGGDEILDGRSDPFWQHTD